MSDHDNLREDEYERKLEASNEARDAAIDYHAENWMTAVTKSVEKSNGTFDDVTDYEAVKKLEFSELLSKPYPKHPANSVDVFIEELHNLDFMERAARILIDYNHGKSFTQDAVAVLFKDMAANYADYKYENSIKD